MSGPKHVVVTNSSIGPFAVGPAHFNVRDVNFKGPDSSTLLTPYLPPSNFSIRVLQDLDNSEIAARELLAHIEAGHCRVQDHDGRVFHAIGFDTETRPKFHKGGPPPPVALVQLATNREAYLFRVGVCGVAPSLRQILDSSDIIKVGIGCAGDVKGLSQIIPGITFRNNFLSIEGPLSAKFPLLRRLGLQSAIASIAGKKMSKKAQLSNWDRAIYTPGMIQYAALDALAGLQLLHHIVDVTDPDLSRASKPNRMEVQLSCAVCSQNFPSLAAKRLHYSGRRHISTAEEQGLPQYFGGEELEGDMDWNSCVVRPAAAGSAASSSALQRPDSPPLELRCSACTTKKDRVFASQKALESHFQDKHVDTPPSRAEREQRAEANRQRRQGRSQQEAANPKRRRHRGPRSATSKRTRQDS